MSPDGNVAPVETLMSVLAESLPSTLLVPVADSLATAVGVTLADAVGAGVADGRLVGEALGTALGVAEGATEADAVGFGDADARAAAEAEADAVADGDALASIGDGAAEGEAVVVLPGVTGVSVDEPLLQAVRTAAEVKRTNVALRRRAKNEYIVNRSQARSNSMPLAFNAAPDPFCEHSYT